MTRARVFAALAWLCGALGVLVGPVPGRALMAAGQLVVTARRRRGGSEDF